MPPYWQTSQSQCRQTSQPLVPSVELVLPTSYPKNGRDCPVRHGTRWNAEGDYAQHSCGSLALRGTQRDATGLAEDGRPRRFSHAELRVRIHIPSRKSQRTFASSLEVYAAG